MKRSITKAKLMGVACLFLCSWLSGQGIADWGDYLETNKAVEVLEGPDASFPTRATLEADRLVVELDRIRGFVQVRIPDQSHLPGWIRARDLDLVQRWAEAADYPPGHPAATGDLSGKDLAPGGTHSQGLGFGTWALIVLLLLVPAALIAVRLNLVPPGLRMTMDTRVGPALSWAKHTLCQRLCGHHFADRNNDH